VVNVTEVPFGTAVLLLSLTVAVMVDELLPSAGMLVGFAVRVMEPTPLATKETLTCLVMVP
jgi:hypothetical protein